MFKGIRVAIVLGVLALAFAVGVTGVAAQGSNRVHVVQRGETLAAIARQYNTTVEALMQLNTIVNPNYIYAGQQLIIPATGGPVVPVTGVHVVQSGEYLGLIAQRYGLTVADLVAFNGLTNPSRIFPGQRLLIPLPGDLPSTPTVPVQAVHIVQSGEYLGLIAQRYGVSVQAIAAANNITNTSRIYAGQRLVIPGVVVTPPPTVPASRVHIVASGENLFRIAQRYGVTVEAIAAANGITNINRVYVGQRLVIPRLHVVRSGESLSRIAQTYGTSVAAIMAANGIANANLIYPGQQLVIP